MSSAVTVQDVSKLYRLGEITRGQLLSDIHRWWMKRKARKRGLSLNGDQPEEKDDFWALRNVSFELKQGDTMAVIGANGAGKSTLLKIISRITAPTTGLVRIRGRIGSLLEVGTGFHPQLTGRDNVYLNGAILGMNRNEIKSKFDDIVGFAGLEQFIDTPVKRYSSGMYVRLAFSVSAFLEPEILIIDEVLSVGDQQFQVRCMQRIQEIMKDGRTLMFVSHGAAVVRSICRRAICLSRGKLIFDGDVNDALAVYAESTKQAAEEKRAQAKSDEVFLDPRTSTAAREWPDLETAPGNEVVKLRSVRIVNSCGIESGKILTAETASLEIEFLVLEGGRCLLPSALFVDGIGNNLFWTTDTDPELRSKPMNVGCYKSTMAIPADLLAPGTILICTGIIELADKLKHHAHVPNALSIIVIDDFSETSVRCGYKGIIPGFFRPRMQWVTEQNCPGNQNVLVPVMSEDEHLSMKKITPYLWFDDNAEEAVKFYTSLFRNSKILQISHYGEAGSSVVGRPKGSVMTISFQLEGQEFMALNGGPHFKFTPAISLMVNCETQAGIDEYWDKLSAGGETQRCGWLTDKFGVSWQIVPTALVEMMHDDQAEKSERVMKAILEMEKLDLPTLVKAYAGK